MLSEMTMIHTRTLRKIMREDPSFPRAISFGPRLSRWRHEDIKKWLESKSSDVVDDV